MTASEPPAKWGADIRGDDYVVCRVEEGRAAAARRRRRGNQGMEEWNSKMADSKAHQVPEQQTDRKHNNIINRFLTQVSETGPRHLTTGPDPGQARVGPHMGIPLGEAR